MDDLSMSREQPENIRRLLADVSVSRWDKSRTPHSHGEVFEIQELYSNIQGIRDQLIWALYDGGADAIESHHQALFSEVGRIEGAAAQEAQTRGWDFNMAEEMSARACRVAAGELSASRCSRERSTRACQVAAGERSAR
jgi:hypothetical protein